MKTVQFLQTTPEKLKKLIVDGVKKEIDDLKKHMQPKESPVYVTRKYVAEEMIHCDLSSVHNLTVKGILKKYQIGGRILYKRQEVEDAIIEIKIAKGARNV